MTASCKYTFMGVFFSTGLALLLLLVLVLGDRSLAPLGVSMTTALLLFDSNANLVLISLISGLKKVPRLGSSSRIGTLRDLLLSRDCGVLKLLAGNDFRGMAPFLIGVLGGRVLSKCSGLRLGPNDTLFLLAGETFSSAK